MLKRVLLFIPFIFFTTLFAQQQQLDSVFKETQKLYNKEKYNAILLKTFTTDSYSLQTAVDSLLFSKILYLKANSFYHLDAYRRALPFYNIALNYTTNNEAGKNQKGTILFDRAFAEYELQQYLKSYKTVKEAERILSALKNPNYDYLVSIYADISSTSTYYGFFEEAEYYIKKALKLYEKKYVKVKDQKSNQASKEIVFKHKLIYLYSREGDEVKMLQAFKEFEKLKKQQKFNTNEQRLFAISLNHIGDYYLNFKDKLQHKKPLQKGKQYLLKAIEALDVKKYPNDLIEISFNLVKQLRYSKDFKKALNENQKMIDLASKNDFRTPFFYAQRGIIYAEKGDKENALKELYTMASFIHDGKEKLQKNGANFIPDSDLNHTGLLVEIPEILLKHFPNDAVVLQQCSFFYKMGLQQFENCYEGEEFSDKLKNYYNLTIDGLLKTEKLGFGTLQNAQILNAIENIENRLAWKEFIHNRNYSKKSIPDSIIKKDFSIRKKLVVARKSSDSLEVLDLENQLKTHKAFLTQNYPVISKSIFSNFDVLHYQKKIKKDEIIIKYKKIKNTLYLFKITSNAIEIKYVVYSKAFEKQLKAHIQLLKNIDEDKTIAQAIFKQLFPFDLNGFKNIIIIPDGILHHLPFESLMIDAQQYFIENYTISYASDLIFTKSTNFSPYNKGVLQLFAPNYTSKNNSKEQQLKGAKEETNFIASLFRSELFTNDLATKSNFIKHTSKASLIHIATHAKIDNEKPELSHLLFSDSKNDNLYLEELYALKLNAKLAVLSACNTGKGSLNSNKGAVSLQRAFTFAGVPATVSSLWKVPDKETAQIMRLFYTYLKSGVTKSKALQLAKKEYLKTTNDPFLVKPYYWAGFVLNGNTDAVVAAKTTINDSTYFFVSIILIGSLLFVFRKKLLKLF